MWCKCLYVGVDATYQLTPAHKPLPSALHLSFVFVITPPPFPLLPSSHKYFIDYIPTTLNSAHILPCSKNIYKEKTIKQSKQQKTNSQVTKKVSNWKQAYVGMKPSITNQTRWQWHHNTFTPYHLYILCHFANHAYHKTLCTPANLQTNKRPYPLQLASYLTTQLVL